jgi:hypothetical protein
MINFTVLSLGSNCLADPIVLLCRGHLLVSPSSSLVTVHYLAHHERPVIPTEVKASQTPEKHIMEATNEPFHVVVVRMHDVNRRSGDAPRPTTIQLHRPQNHRKDLLHP